jgi:hypothetical protein
MPYFSLFLHVRSFILGFHILKSLPKPNDAYNAVGSRGENKMLGLKWVETNMRYSSIDGRLKSIGNVSPLNVKAKYFLPWSKLPNCQYGKLS